MIEIEAKPLQNITVNQSDILITTTILISCNQSEGFDNEQLLKSLKRLKSRLPTSS